VVVDTDQRIGAPQRTDDFGVRAGEGYDAHAGRYPHGWRWFLNPVLRRLEEGSVERVESPSSLAA